MKLPNGKTCNDYVHRCNECHASGCSNNDCRNQTFNPGNGRCLRCGKGHR
jgi:hypothetical protein